MELHLKDVYYNDGINKVYQQPDGTIIETAFFIVP